MLQIYNKAKLLIIVSLLITLASCMGKEADNANSGKKKVRREVNLDKRAEQDAAKLRKSGGGLFSGNSNNFEFSTSNPLWRATLQTLEFIPLNTVSYSGGIIVTDWYSSNNSNEEIKFDVRFLSNDFQDPGERELWFSLGALLRAGLNPSRLLLELQNHAGQQHTQRWDGDQNGSPAVNKAVQTRCFHGDILSQATGLLYW